ncbi:MAG TPA: hypothetical protein VE594_02810 [Nitrososphaeraceae archaeon]|jgi:hypothetical protein|nr:hypothetical protein [Nitrososphaeraceae archaeon]
MKDFGRLVCALERTPLPTFSLILNKDHVFGVQTDFINGRQVIYFVKHRRIEAGQYVAYRITGTSEEVMVVDCVGNPTFVYSPIIKIEKFPARLARTARIDKKSRYIAIGLKDLSSLAKVAAYKAIYDEPPLPLFFFKILGDAEKFAVGAAMSLNEPNTTPYFYYILLKEEPKDPFLRFSSQRPEQPSFSSRIDEHGNIYLKLIKLADNHPLVGIDGQHISFS